MAKGLAVSSGAKKEKSTAKAKPTSLSQERVEDSGSEVDTPTKARNTIKKEDGDSSSKMRTVVKKEEVGTPFKARNTVKKEEGHTPSKARNAIKKEKTASPTKLKTEIKKDSGEASSRVTALPARSAFAPSPTPGRTNGSKSTPSKTASAPRNKEESSGKASRNSNGVKSESVSPIRAEASEDSSDSDSVKSESNSSIKEEASTEENSSDSDVSEEDEDSETSEDEGSSAAHKIASSAAITNNGVKRKAGERGGIKEEESQSKRPKLESSTDSSDGSSDESSEAEYETADEHEVKSAADEGEPMEGVESPQPSADTATNGWRRSQVMPAKPYRPPPGYTPFDAVLPSADSMLSANTLASKQIWHVVAAANVPLSSLTEISLEAIRSKAPVLKHDGREYAFHEDNTASTQSHVMVPSDKGYVLAPHHIHSTLHLQQKITLPQLGKKQADPTLGSEAAADIALAPLSVIRPQPKGLRMRYKPPGFGSGNPGAVGLGLEDSDEDEDDASNKAAFQFPKTLGAHSVNREEVVEKAKKAKKSKAGTDTTATKSEAQSKEEKAKRKEQKRQKKEAKLRGKGE